MTTRFYAFLLASGLTVFADQVQYTYARPGA